MGKDPGLVREVTSSFLKIFKQIRNNPDRVSLRLLHLVQSRAGSRTVSCERARIMQQAHQIFRSLA